MLPWTKSKQRTVVVTNQSGREGILAKQIVFPSLLSIWYMGITEATLKDIA